MTTQERAELRAGIMAANGENSAVVWPSTVTGGTILALLSELDEKDAELARVTNRRVELAREVAQLAIESVEREKQLARLEAEVLAASLAAEECAEPAKAEAEGRDGCGTCRYKLEGEAWKYYNYPCRECCRRCTDHYAEAAPAARTRQEAEHVHPGTEP